MKFIIDIEFYGTATARCTVNTTKERDKMIDRLLLNVNVKHISYTRYYKSGRIGARTFVS